MPFKNRILVYSTQFMPTGGIESHLQEFCKQMAANGTEIDFVILNSRMLPETRKQLAAVCRKIYFADSKWMVTRFLYLISISLRIALHQYTSLYTNGQGESVKLFSRLFRYCNWVHHHHTSGDAADQASWGKHYIAALQTADTVIACSSKNAGLMEAFLQRKIGVIPCFSREIDMPEPALQGTIENNKVKFGYYGRLIPEKGIETLCRLSRDPDMSNAQFHIWGEGEVYTASYFKTYPLVQYHGAFSGKESLTKVIRAIDAFLLLSTHPEGLPISLLEVMSAGLPWLATDKGGIPDIVSDPFSTRVISAESSYEQIKTAILQFIADIRGGKVSRSVQKELYKTRFSAKALVQQWENVLCNPK